ncbi:MAG: efflux transporter periplasmic adaptor subunit [Sphingobacteriales bacterium]|nr:efflux transporter periplasmic adaptor subunit [Sphingobacteriales bacterium]
MRYTFNSLFLNVVLVAVMASGCNSGKKEEKPKLPAEQSNPVKEGDLNKITLTEKAVQRLGIQTVKVINESVNNSRSFSAEVTAVPGKLITITAPVAGTLIAARNGRTITAGQNVSKGQQIGRLIILPSEKDLLSAREDLARTQVQYNTSSEKVKRTSQLYAEKAGSLRAKQEAEAELAAITAQLRVAQNRLQLLRGNTSQGLADRMSTLNLEAPITGVVQRVYSSSNQVLANAAPIADIVSLRNLWLRVPVYAGDEALIDARGIAFVQGLSDFQGASGTVTARPVTGPPTSDPLATSVDLYYEIDNSKGDFRPGQKISITLPYKGSHSGLVVPFSAVLYDIYGGAWVYENTEPNVFVRRRVELLRVANKKAILKQGPPVGAKIVTLGAAELFGTEFGGGK